MKCHGWVPQEEADPEMKSGDKSLIGVDQLRKENRESDWARACRTGQGLCPPGGAPGCGVPIQKVPCQVKMASTLPRHLAAQPVAAGLPKRSMTLGAQPRGIHVKLTAGS